MLDCDIVSDLLPVYASGDCSEATRTAIEEHFATCDRCSNKSDSMNAPLVLSGLQTVEVEPEEFKSDEAENSEQEVSADLRKNKVRRRWITAILCVVLAIPIIGLGILAVNDSRGKGITYSNLDHVKRAETFAQSLRDGDFGTAFDFLDTDSIYAEIHFLNAEPFVQLIDRWSFRSLTVDEEKYYTQAKVTDIETVLQGMPAAEFWAHVILRNAEEPYCITPIPEAIFAEAARLARTSSGTDILVVDISSDLSDSSTTYVRFTAENGKDYYRPTSGGRLNSDFNWFRDADYIPESMFDLILSENAREFREARARIEDDQSIGSEEFRETLKQSFTEKLTRLSENGLRITSFSVGTPYRVEDRYAEIENASIRSTDNLWFMDIALGTSGPNQDEIILSVQVSDEDFEVIFVSSSEENSELASALSLLRLSSFVYYGPEAYSGVFTVNLSEVNDATMFVYE